MKDNYIHVWTHLWCISSLFKQGIQIESYLAFCPSCLHNCSLGEDSHDISAGGLQYTFTVTCDARIFGLIHLCETTWGIWVICLHCVSHMLPDSTPSWHLEDPQHPHQPTSSFLSGPFQHKFKDFFILAFLLSDCHDYSLCSQNELLLRGTYLSI